MKTQIVWVMIANNEVIGAVSGRDAKRHAERDGAADRIERRTLEEYRAMSGANGKRPGNTVGLISYEQVRI